MAPRKSSFRPGRPVVTPALQHLHISHRFPSFAFSRESGGGAWRGTLQPRESSPAYRVLVRYKVGDVPRVWVTWPKLAPGAPHLYPGGRLCLYWPREWVWRSDELIADTILPWTALWLYFYELWLDCGEWLGPSSHGAAPMGSEVQHAY
jgi:hypothetical protein